MFVPAHSEFRVQSMTVGKAWQPKREVADHTVWQSRGTAHFLLCIVLGLFWDWYPHIRLNLFANTLIDILRALSPR